MESAGKRKQSDNKANDAKKPRRSCLAKRTSTINVKRDPTEPIIKLKRSRVSFAPKEAVKGKWCSSLYGRIMITIIVKS